MPDRSAFVSPALVIRPDFGDHNGHVNMAYHVVLADEALDICFQQLKGADYLDGRGLTSFTAEAHVRYLREIALHDEVRGRVTWVDADEKRARWAVELVRGSDGAVLTTVEGVSMSVSVETRRVTPFPPDVQARLAAAVARDRKAAENLQWLGRSVGMSRDQPG